ncbi:MAG: hypothetical protein QOF63_1775 [Thermoanaerobaculia bacterium]|jgi:hypothetical protein|nr:hypothetical protein [Thermoanaerobaculia bacterium]MEA2414267.1 hypothetical protein [Thermoanaerobaculia bacterium]
MRKTIRVYVLAISVLTAASAPVYATPSGSRSDDSFFTRLKNAVVRILDEAKISVPVG